MNSRRLVLAFAVALILGCGSANSPHFNIVSVEDEWQLGAQMARDLSQQLQLVNDPDSLAYVRDIGQRMVSHTAMSTLPWEFHIVRDDQVNAFSIPGGHVYINTGLIKAAHSASELAGVMAHEISHVVKRHATQQMSRQYGIDILSKAALGTNPSTYQQIVTSAISNGAMAKFSREEEKEADETGVKLMYDAGYDPNGMANMFRTLLAEQKTRPTAVEKFFATHPLTEDRIKDVEQEASKLPKKAGLIADEPQFHTIKEKLQ
jgi:predicted Zn-dependent protease